MSSESPARTRQIIAWLVFAVILSGFFYSPIEMFTGPLLGLWLAGTQRPLRGLMILVGFDLLFALPHTFLQIHHFAPLPALIVLGWLLVATVAGALPFTFYRLVGPRLPPIVSTLPFPLCAVALQFSYAQWLPASAAAHLAGRAPAPWLAAALGPSAASFLVLWFVAVLLWMWNVEFRRAKLLPGALILAVPFALAIGFAAIHQLQQNQGRWYPGAALAAPQWKLPAESSGYFGALSLAAALALALWAAIAALRSGNRPARVQAAVAQLRSPHSGEPLSIAPSGLVSTSGEHFPLRRGIPDLRAPQDMTGLNLKYNGLYQVIGGFYDDSQRIIAALQGFDRDAYVMSYLQYLHLKPGDSVLETSVGTGLNFKYLPAGLTLTGLDLSEEMLINCKANLRRWGLGASLVLGNAERLPFADSSFDAVFHVGGINFFNDRARAIREMIRVARPGSPILIADETEEHVKAAYENSPLTGGLYKKRTEHVTPPVDLVPPEMLEKHLHILHVVGKNRFYSLTFRKPLTPDSRAVGATVGSPVL